MTNSNSGKKSLEAVLEEQWELINRAYEEVKASSGLTDAQIERAWKEIKASIGKQKVQKVQNAQDILFSLGKKLTTWKYGNGKIIVYFENCEVKKGAFLEGTFGIGENFEQACENYLEQLHGQTLVFNATSPGREEIRVL